MAREKAYPQSPVVMVFKTSNRSNASTCTLLHPLVSEPILEWRFP